MINVYESSGYFNMKVKKLSANVHLVRERASAVTIFVSVKSAEGIS